MNKTYPSAGAALDGLLRDGMLIAAGGFGLCGVAKPPIFGAAGTETRRRNSSRLSRYGRGRGSMC